MTSPIARVTTYFLSLALLSLLSACSVNPVTGERELSLLSTEQEIAMGEKNYIPAQQQQGGRYVVDPDLNAYVANVGRKLAQVSHNPNLPYEFVVLNNGQPNAWAMPGGKIAVNRGLLVLLEDEAQLAAVLGHEIVHAAARHGAQQQSRAGLLQVGLQVAGVAAQSTEYGDLLTAGAGAGASMWLAKYGRGQELQSDEKGMDYMVKAGYDPMAAVELQETFVKLSEAHNQDWLQGLFASHPPSQERVDKNRAKAKKIGNVGTRNKAAYQRAIAQIKRDQAAYDKYEAGLKAAGEKDLSKALTLVDQAIAKQPEEALFYSTKGQLLLMQKKTSNAKSAFNSAVNKNPEYFLGQLGLGLTEKETGNNSSAKNHLLRSVNLLPTQTALYHLGEIEMQAGNKQQAIEYFSVVAQQGGDLGTKAQAQLSKLQATPAQ